MKSKNIHDTRLLAGLLGVGLVELYVYDHVRVPSGKIGTIIRALDDKRCVVRVRGEDLVMHLDSLTLHAPGSGRR